MQRLPNFTIIPQHESSSFDFNGTLNLEGKIKRSTSEGSVSTEVGSNNDSLAIAIAEVDRGKSIPTIDSHSTVRTNACKQCTNS